MYEEEVQRIGSSEKLEFAESFRHGQCKRRALRDATRRGFLTAAPRFAQRDVYNYPVDQLALTIATRNPHKTREIQHILGDEFVVRDLCGRSEIPEIAEAGRTFEENAVLKAVAVSRHVNGLVVADDSGLEVDVLGGAPGVLSARYAGEPSDDWQNLQKLINELEQIDPQAVRRTARFRCVVAVAEKGTLLGTFSGTVEGAVSGPPRGIEGFGYDPIFVPDGFDRTFGELPAATKNQLSHRSRALAEASPLLKTAAGR